MKTHIAYSICDFLLREFVQDLFGQIRNAKGLYGALLERYFVKLIGKIFNDKELHQTQEGPDAILESEKNILIFEFTTEHYQPSSLYSSTDNGLHNDLEKILFKDKGGTTKKDPGKFFKLNEYISQLKSNKNIISLLITEKYLGDYDLLNTMDNILSKKISKYENLLKRKPVILCLDEMEDFWSCSKNGANKEHLIDEFAKCIMDWEKSPKNEFEFDFSTYLYQRYKGKESNSEHTNFFSLKGLCDELSVNT
jgi:hypothetical protein